MDEKKYSQLLKKLDSYLSDSPVSPVTLSEACPWTGSLSPNMSFENLTKDEKILAHSLMHRFYPRGTKTLTKQTLEKLHNEVKKLINHKTFDQLDRIEQNEQ